jgi:hypothetical protein
MNAEVRAREYLTSVVVAKLVKDAGSIRRLTNR